MPYDITGSDMESFDRCRRAWDLGSRLRQDYEPRPDPAPFDFGAAIRCALAVYYSPATWDWLRGAVRPLTVQAFRRSILGQRDRYLARHVLTPGQDEAWQAHLELGDSILASYAGWAPTVDAFEALRVDADFAVHVPDPDVPAARLVTTGGEPVRYRGRIDLLVMDAGGMFWLVRHRLADGGWADTEDLLRDEEPVAQAWAWQRFCPTVRVAGTIYNELRTDVYLPLIDPAGPGGRPRPTGPEHSPERLPESRAGVAPGGLGMAPGGPGVPLGGRGMAPGAPGVPPEVAPDVASEGAPRGPGVPPGTPSRPGRRVLAQHGNELFRRTRILHSPADQARTGRHLARLARQMTDRYLTVYPNPSPTRCPTCPYREPCAAMEAGVDPAGILRRSFQRRPPPEEPQQPQVPTTR